MGDGVRSVRVAGVVLAVAAAFLPGCEVRWSASGAPGIRGSGVAATETREVPAFTRVRLEGAGRLELTTGPAGPLTIEGDDNLLPLVEATVDGEELVLRPTQSISPRTALVFRASVPSLSRVESAGAAEISVTGLEAGAFEVVVRGAAAVVATGRTDALAVVVEGAGSVDTTALLAQDVTVTASGAGDIAVHSERTVGVTVAGVGRVAIAGPGELVRKQVSGLGVVSRR